MGRRGRKPIEQLTDEHVQILACVGLGMTNRQIGDLMDRSGHWVNGRLRTIFRLLGAHTRAQAVAVAVQRGLLPGAEGEKRR